MALLELELPFDSQPQDAERSDGSASLASGLVTLFNAAHPNHNAAGGRLSTGELQAAAKARGVTVTGATTSGYISDGATVSGDRTIAFLVRLATATPGTTVMYTSTTGAGVAYWIGAHAGSTAWSIGGNVSAGAGTLVADTDVLIVATKRGTTHSIYLDGVFKASATTAMADGSGGSTWLRYGSGTSNTWTASKGAIYMGAAWNRALSDSEVAELSLNPWQLFEPQRIPIYIATAGGTSFNPAWAIRNARVIGAGVI